MPYDKVVDSAVLESGLTSIANAIREKAGTSDALAFPAGFAEAIAAIESGGFSSELFDVSCGSFIPASSNSTFIVTCNFDISESDKFAFLYAGFPISEISEGYNIAGFNIVNTVSGALDSTKYGGHIYASLAATKCSTTTSAQPANVLKSGCSSNEVEITGYGNWKFTTGCEYFWIVIKEKTA